MAPEYLSWGQRLALDQLSDIVTASDGSLDIVQTELPSSEGALLCLRLSISTSEYEFQAGGFKFRQREPLRLFIPSKFPIRPPTVKFAHMRFLGRAHVQWGDHICMYLAPDVEWSPSDGMFGFIKRLDEWLRDAACDQLDPDNAPLHPPVTYPSSDISISIEIDTPNLDSQAVFWVGAAKLSERNTKCYDVSGWAETPKSLPKQERYAAVILLKQAMPIEYPDTISKLISALKQRGIPFDLLFSLLKITALCQNEGEPLFFILGAPMRRRKAGEPLRQHLTAWKMTGEHVKALRTIVLEETDETAEEAWKLIIQWAIEAQTEWCHIHDNRPEITFRRDQGTSASWFLGKRVAILGCGALGSHIGEYLARAGATKLRLVDHSVVKPGILVRQQFEHYQVGYTKESSLARKLEKIGPKADIDFLRFDLTQGWPDGLSFDEFDFVVDATASRRVAAALQLDWSSSKETPPPPILRCAISGDASLGLASLRMPNSLFGPSDLIRQTKLTAFHTPELSSFARAFWPQEQQEAGFQPEPGCSEPTFVGSAADIAFFASSFFNFAARELQGDAEDDVAKVLFVSAPNDHHSIFSQVVDLGKAELGIDACHGYSVHVSPGARKAIESEIKSNARTGSSRNETGGLLLGEIDDSLLSISIDVSTGPPPDSKKSPELFLCGVEGTDALCEFHAEASGNSSRFIGVWHTHPVSMPEPSDIDLGAMAQILHSQEQTPRHVVMLIVGFAATNPVWRFHLFRKNQFQVIAAKKWGELDGR